MAVIQSSGQLANVQSDWWPQHSYGSLRLYDDYNYAYARIWRTQPNVRTCVDFLARNIAQLGLHVFRRLSDTDRERLTEHPLAQVIKRPLPPKYKVTRYRLMENLVGDLGVYFNAYWLKVRRDDLPAGLMRIDPAYMHVKGGMSPTEYEIRLPGWQKKLDPEEVVHFRGYNAEDALVGLSPLETLRRILAEEHAAGEYREHFWQNAARMHGIIERPPDAPEWSRAARQRFKAEFEALYSGKENSGKTAILEEGMEWKAAQFNAEQSEYLGGRKLTREECARAYHIPPPMVGILEHATFSNITEQHKNLYQDTLAPWLKMIEEDIELQLLPEFEDIDRVYVEFNIEEKMKGSFEEQTKALQSAVGAPYMTRNEARARQNLPTIEGGDVLVTPLNVLMGGQASPWDATPEGRGGAPDESKVRELKALDLHNQELRERHEAKWREVFTRHFRRQEASIVSRVPEAPGKADLGGVWYDEERWENELYEDVLPMNEQTASTWAEMAVGAMDAEVDEDVMKERMRPYLEEHSRIQSEYITGFTRDRLQTAINSPEPRESVKELFEQALSVWAVREATTAVTAASNFGAREGAKASGLSEKTWQVNSGNPRPEHAAQDGMTIGIDERFPNGQRWPGDPAGGADQNAGCMCSVNFS